MADRIISAGEVREFMRERNAAHGWRRFALSQFSGDASRAFAELVTTGEVEEHVTVYAADGKDVWCSTRARFEGVKDDEFAIINALADEDGYVASHWILAEHPRAPAERRIVERLSREMLTKLAARREHGSWDNDIWAAMNGAFAEVEELRQAVRDYDVSGCAATRAEVIREAADVANFCAMLIDVVTADAGRSCAGMPSDQRGSHE